MGDFFLGEIRMFSFNYAPVGWALCNGAILPISQNPALYSLLSNNYGGSYPNTFALPDLRGRVPVNFGESTAGWDYVLGQMGGYENVTLTVATMPAHSHDLMAQTMTATQFNPKGHILAAPPPTNSTPHPIYGGQGETLTPMNSQSIGSTGGEQPHGNIQPSLVINFCISTIGIYPPRP